MGRGGGGRNAWRATSSGERGRCAGVGSSGDGEAVRTEVMGRRAAGGGDGDEGGQRRDGGDV